MDTVLTFRLARSAQIAFRRSTVPVTPVYFVTPCEGDRKNQEV